MNQYSRERVKGFLHANGRCMVNGDGEKVVLRGWGVGNWMNPEGFMIGGVPLFQEGVDFAAFAAPRRFERGRSVESTVRELCGSAYASEFQRRWIRNYLTEDDIALMAELGYNSVRLPISARLFLAEEPGIHWIEENFAVLTQVFDWCEKHRIYAILDLHGAPGGQSGLACDDGLDNRPHTFTEPESRERTMLLWEEMAKRYACRWIIGGYDLLNEPLSGPACFSLLDELAGFYEELISRIRKYDKNHMVTLEGAIFSMDLSAFDHEFDPECHNWCIHTHYYGFSPEERELYRFLDASISCNVPVWIGEGGSDPVSNSIYYEIAGTYDIGFAMWAWKSAADPDGNGSGTVRYPLPKDWDIVHSYIMEGGPRPSYEEAQSIFDEMLENVKLCHCTVAESDNRYHVRRPGITLPAVGFDAPEESRISHGWKYGNSFKYRTETGMKLVRKQGCEIPKQLVEPVRAYFPPANPLNSLCLELRQGEAVTYTIREVKEGCEVTLTGRCVGGKRAVLTVTAIGGLVERQSVVFDTAETTEKMCAHLAAGLEWKIRVLAEEGCVQLDSIAFKE